MRYLKVLWHHKSPDDPVTIWSEIDEDGYEVRKVEQYADGRIGYADSTTSAGGSVLGEFPVPEIQEISRYEEFSPAVISQKAFQKKWATAKSAKRDKQPKVRRITEKRGARRNLKVTRTKRGWSVYSPKSRRPIAVFQTEEAATAWAREVLQSTVAPGSPPKKPHKRRESESPKSIKK
jgi:hypothetical protein